MKLAQLNTLPATEAAQVFEQCCAAPGWVAAMVAQRPFASPEALHECADALWQAAEEADYLAAFLAHPKIGDVNSLHKKFANTKTLAAGEQSGVNTAMEDTLRALAEKNDAYFEKFGFIFIVCATGKSAEQMLAILTTRLANDRATEIHNAASEQLKITQLRLDKLLASAED